MKHLFVALAMCLSGLGFAQCESDAFMDKCAGNLAGALFIKSLVIKSGDATEAKPNNFSYVFSKGATYNIVICDQGAGTDKLVVTLLDRNKKEIASNYNKKTKKFYPSLAYPCGATGVYYIESYFPNEKPGTCGVAILGFTK